MEAANHSLMIFTHVLAQPTSMLHLIKFKVSVSRDYVIAEWKEEVMHIESSSVWWLAYSLAVFLRSQLMNNIAKYMAPRENTRWKNP